MLLLAAVLVLSEALRPMVCNCFAGEWLCWPCKRYEEQQLALGKAQAEVRPPRWESAAADAAGSPSRSALFCYGLRPYGNSRGQ